MRVDEVFKQAASQGTAPVSFEMFPPKGELTLDTARELAGNLCKLSPSFVSVTCSAGGSGSVVDANSTTKGVLQLAGDLGGTAASPTVPGLAGKADKNAKG